MKDFQMKNFKCIKQRIFKDYNYNALWYDNQTIRIGAGQASELPPEYSEFYDISLGSVCSTGCCDFCYVSSNPNGKFYEDICETWKKWMAIYKEEKVNGITITEKPLQIALGSQGEPLEHPSVCEFLQTVYETGVVPNYTTNGVILSYYNKPDSKYYKLANKILDYTEKYVGGVAVSYGNKHLRHYALQAIQSLIGKCYVNIHHIVSDEESVDDFVHLCNIFTDDIKYHVLLPLMPHGRSKEGIQDGVFEYLEEIILKNDIKNVAFGAHFTPYLKNSKIKTWLYEPESFSKNVLLEKDKVIITPSSFDITPCKIINL